MKRLLELFLCLVIVLSGCSKGFTTITIDPNESEKTYGVWFSYLDFDELTYGKNEQEFTAEIKNMMNQLELMGLNRIYVHACAFTDAFYASSYYPWSKYLSGSIGRNPGYDPLKIIVEEAEFKKIKVDAWINPMRSFTVDEIRLLSSDYPLRALYNDMDKRSECFMEVNGRLYLNPGSDEVLNLICSVARELLDNYGIGGIHIDDYFYPSGMEEEMDKITYANYLEINPNADVSEYRLAMTDRLVRTLYNIVHEYDDKIFSISPNANVDTNKEVYYCDVARWLANPGYCDVMIPQIYFGFDNETMPFEKVVNQWQQMATGRIDLLFGLAAYKVGKYDEYALSGSNEWIENTDILSRQIAYLRSRRYYNGVVFFRYMDIFEPDSDIYDQMQIEMTKARSLLNE